MDDQAYLEPGFDPSTLTMPRLRSILVAHGVNYPASAKKGQLVDLFNETVLPQARKIRSANARVKRTSRGIIDVPASQSSVNGDEDDEDEQVPLPSTARRSGGRSTRARTEEAQEVQPTPRSTRHSTAPPEGIVRRASSKHAREVEQSEPEQEPEAKRPASRKSKLSAATPVAKSETADGDSPFSAENVFQTGSSPPPPTTDRRRTTQSALKDAERRRSRDARRRTEEFKPTRAQMDGAVVPTRKTFNVPVSAAKKEEVAASEEFTPEEQQELVQAQQSGELVPARPRTRRPANKAARTGISAFTVAVLTGVAALWGQEKFQVGYCGEGHASSEIAGVKIPEWADIARPQCEPCPPHAICYQNLQTECERGFVLSQNPLSFGGVLPLPPTCEPDSATARKVNAVKERAIEELREQNAKYECSEAATPDVKEPELKERISSKRSKKMSDQEWDSLWESALGELAKADEVSEGTDGSGRLVLRSSSLARLPLSCAIRRSLRETLREYLWQLIGILLITSSAAYGRYAITSGRETEVKAKQLASLALEKLSTQASLHASDPNTYRENYIPMAQLRDDVLRDEFSTMRRKTLWEKVQRKVEHNSNVRPMVREGRSGDVGRVWEWVGAIGMLESLPPSNDRRKSGRVSFGGERWIEPATDVEHSTEMSQVSKWEEGRQYY